MIWQTAIEGLGVAVTIAAAPLLIDLTVCVTGFGRRARRAGGPLLRPIELAVVIPAHNEEQLITRTVDSVRAAQGLAPVFVVAHNCEDRTALLAMSAGARVVELNDAEQRGKGAALRAGFAAALASGANAVLVIDADSLVSANLIEAVRTALEAGADAVQCRYEMEPMATEGRAALLARLRALAVRGMNVVRARGRAGWGFSTGLYGNGFALTAELLERVPLAVDGVAEDAEYHIRLACAGVPVRWIGEARVSAQLAAVSANRAQQQARWEGGRLGLAARGSGRLLLATLGGRWKALETLLDVASLPLARGVLALIVMALLPLPWLHWIALAGALIVLLYVFEAAATGPHPFRDLLALAAAPVYIVWSALLTPKVLLQARRRANWSRTDREAQP